MFSVLRTAWPVIVKRVAADWFILSAAAVTILLAAVLLAAGPIYADAVTVSGARRTLADAPIGEANVEVSVRILPDSYLESNAIVTSEMARTFTLTGGTLSQQVVSQSYQLPDQHADGIVDLAVFESFQSIEEHASIVAGTWPTRGEEPYETALSESAAEMLGISVGDELTMTGRTDRTDQPTVKLAGIYSIDDPEDPYWYDDQFDITGIDEGTAFRTFGPFVIDLETMLLRFSPLGSDVNWRAFPSYDNLEVSEISEMRRRVDGLEARLDATQDPSTAVGLAFRVDTRAGRILADTERSLVATRSSVLILSIQLAILAGYALMLTAGLLVESRRTETNLLRSRGASNKQVLAMATMEGVILTLPAVLFAPWIAVMTLRLFNVAGPLAAIDLTIDPTVTRASYLLAFLAAVGCISALAIPAQRSAKLFGDATASRGREKSRTVLQRSGIDVALLLLAAVAYWQLQRNGSQITSTVQGRLATDPLLMVAPTLGMLAGAVLALRTIPMLARLAERTATAGTSVVRALSAWQIARRPQRYSRSALLLIMAITIGLLAASYTVTWSRSQDDQADYQTGADISVAPNRRIGASIPEMNLSDAHSQIEAVQTSMPVVRQLVELSRSVGPGRFVMLDAAQAGSVVRIREDLSDRPFSELTKGLLDQRPSLSTSSLPGEPLRIAIDLGVAVEPLAEDFELPEDMPESRVEFIPSASVVLQDGNGLLHRVDLGPVAVDTGIVRLQTELTYTLLDGRVASPIYPVSLLDIEIRSPAPLLVDRVVTIDIGGIFISQTTEGDTWEATEADLTPTGWSPSHARVSPARKQPSIAFSDDQPTSGVRLAVNSGISATQIPPSINFSLRLVGTQLPDRFPVIVSEGFLDATETSIGDEIEFTSLRAQQTAAVIIGTVKNFPTVDPELSEAILIDLPTYQMMNYETGWRIPPIDERWLQVEQGRTGSVTQQLLGPTYQARTVRDRIEVADDLKSDPVALGTIGALSLGFIAAAMFAAVGFSVSATVSARERVTEFALLRAVGLSPKQLARWLAVELGVLVMVSLVFGSVIGLMLSALILPLISITQDATAAVPDVTVVFPWRTILWLELTVVGVLGALVTVLATVLRRLGLGSLLRLGED